MRDIVVGIDSSAGSERTLDRAFLEAERTGCPLRVVYAWTAQIWLGASGSGLVYAAPLPAPEESRKAAEQFLAEVVAKGLSRRTSATPVELRTETHEGDAGRVLSRLSNDAVLLVVGGSGHGQLASALLGSVTSHVLHHATCPVMVVPSGAPVTPFARVVVGLDGSESSRAAFAWALAEAGPVPLVAVHAWIVNTAPLPIPYTSLPAGAAYERDAEVWLEQEVALGLGTQQGTNVLRRLPYGPAVAALLNETGPDDLLVLGSRGHGGFASLILGSVASQCTAHASGTVVVVRERPAS